MNLFGLIGYPVAHSASPDYFARRFGEIGLADAVYRLFPVSSADLIPLVWARNPDLRGFNVTIPYKAKIIPYLHKIDPVAAVIGAVNTVVVFRDGEKVHLSGYNTDAEGFRQSADFSGHKRAFVLGTGGSSAAVSYILRDEGIDVTLVSRTLTSHDCVRYPEIDKKMMEAHTLIVNTTPLGMFPDTRSAPPLPYKWVTPRHFLYDLVYNPPKTTFLLKGEASGANIQSGEAMLKLQAELSLELFRKALPTV